MTTNHIGWNEVALYLTSHTGPSSRTSYPGLRQKRDCPRRQQASWDVGQSRDPKVLRQRTWEWARWRPVCHQLFSNDFLTIQDLSFLLCELGTVVAARLIWRLRLDELVCIKHLQQCLHVMSTQKKKKKSVLPSPLLLSLPPCAPAGTGENGAGLFAGYLSLVISTHCMLSHHQAFNIAENRKHFRKTSVGGAGSLRRSRLRACRRITEDLLVL